MTKRTDTHRAGAIIPAHYREVLHYELPGGDGMHFAWDCERPTFEMGSGGGCKGHPHFGDACCVRRLQTSGVKFAEHGAPGKCTACGAAFRRGAVFVHDNGEHIHLGHDCADKYEMLMDRSAFEVEMGRHQKARATQLVRQQNAEERAAFLDAHPGLDLDLQVDHRIVRDIAARFEQYRTLSDKQVALVQKLAAEARNPPPPPKHVAAPTGRVDFCGRIVSKKCVESDFGLTTKITVEVTEADGTWLVWCTLPSDAADAERGDVLQFSATLEVGREKHFAFGKRPMLVRPWVVESKKLQKARATDAEARRQAHFRKFNHEDVADEVRREMAEGVTP
jgi:hypothetical protein